VGIQFQPLKGEPVKNPPFGRDDVLRYAKEQYHTLPDYPWMRMPGYAVLRHKGSRKWYAVVMDLPRNRIGLGRSGVVDVMNVKCDPLLIGSLRRQKGFLPAYHMNKDKWLSIVLDGSVSRDQICDLLDLSFELTGGSRASDQKG
jgi:predicted DNA-binding protein (MmcQ/YjbR family)